MRAIAKLDPLEKLTAAEEDDTEKTKPIPYSIGSPGDEFGVFKRTF